MIIVKYEPRTLHEMGRVVLAGVGGDAHFVGLTVLQRGLERAGFDVMFLGAQNNLDAICEEAISAAAVLISNMDGHANYYLDGLSAAQDEFGITDLVWYLGGYPSLTADELTLNSLRQLGFDKIFHGYVDVQTVVRSLSQDMGTRLPAMANRPKPVARNTRATLPVAASPLGSDEPERQTASQVRDFVLNCWSTGAAAADLAANAELMRTRARLADRQASAAAAGSILVQPRTGVSSPNGQRDLFSAMRQGGADVLTFQIDSLTRNNRYQEIEQILKASLDDDSGSRLNGYPAVNHGVERLAALSEEFDDLPMQVRHSTRDPRLLAEITFAGGVAAFEGGAITYNLPYYRDLTPAQSLRDWRYVDELAAQYHERHGIVIDREFFGVLTACLVPPSIAVVANLFEAMLAAECGVKSVTLGYAEQGNRRQDLAAVRVLKRMTREYLQSRDIQDVAISVVWHQYMGPFPRSETKSRELLLGSARMAVRSGAVRLMLKTYAEAWRIPDVEDNFESLQLVKAACLGEAGSGETALDAEDLLEEEMIEAEVRCVVDAALAAAEGAK